MAKTIVSLFDDFRMAQSAARALIDTGYPRENISVIANDVTGEYGGETGPDVDIINESDLSGAGVGAGVGAALGGIGGLLVGLGAIAIPGIGPVIAAGPLVTALLSAGAGAGVGAVAGGLVGALVDVGVPEEEAGYFAEGVRRGGALLTVQVADDTDNQVLNIINTYQPVNIEERAAGWREKGWSGFDASATPYTAGELAEERTTYRTYSTGSRGTGYGENFSTSNPDYESRGWAEVEPAPGETSYQADRLPTDDPNYVSRGWAEVEPAPGEQTYRERPPTDDPNYVSRGWAEVEPPAGEQAETRQTGASQARSETNYTARQGNQSWVESRPPAEGRVDIDENAAHAWEETKDTARRGWEEVKDTARDAWQETKETFDFDDDDDIRFREHFNTNYAGSGYNYDTYAPAYRYGYDLAYDVDFEDRDWDTIEPDVRRFWESNYEGPWDRFKAAVRYAWEATKEAIGLEADEDFKTFDPHFREHYNVNYASSGYDYSYYIPAYRYGYDLAYSEDFDEERDWDEIEPDVHRYWEANYEGPWDQFKAAVRHAWEETKEAIGLEEEDDDVYPSDRRQRNF